ncbi:hypothetical protein B0H14DRAFT_3500064 [Mycena olivaceomarginata]|nr:hypothetical protein B0H14DRAFT_3500064 [Mycena olivaceomarginata]
MIGSGLLENKITAYTAVHQLFSRGGDNQSEAASSDDNVDDRDVDFWENDSRTLGVTPRCSIAMSTDGYASAPPEAPASCADDPDTLSDFGACICNLGRLASLRSWRRCVSAPDWHRIVLALETQLPALREMDFGEGSVWWRYRDTWTEFSGAKIASRALCHGQGST